MCYHAYEDVLICTGLETLATRRHNSCTKFISRLRSEKEDYNPLACIIRREPSMHIDSNYNLRTQTLTNLLQTIQFNTANRFIKQIIIIIIIIIIIKQKLLNIYII